MCFEAFKLGFKTFLKMVDHLLFRSMPNWSHDWSKIIKDIHSAKSNGADNIQLELSWKYTLKPFEWKKKKDYPSWKMEWQINRLFMVDKHIYTFRNLGSTRNEVDVYFRFPVMDFNNVKDPLSSVVIMWHLKLHHVI